MVVNAEDNIDQGDTTERRVLGGGPALDWVVREDPPEVNDKKQPTM